MIDQAHMIEVKDDQELYQKFMKFLEIGSTN